MCLNHSKLVDDNVYFCIPLPTNHTCHCTGVLKNVFSSLNVIFFLGVLCKETQASSLSSTKMLVELHWQTKHWLLGLRPGRPVDNGPQEGNYSAWVAWEKGKMETRKTSQGAQLSLSSRLPSHRLGKN